MATEGDPSTKLPAIACPEATIESTPCISPKTEPVPPLAAIRLPTLQLRLPKLSSRPQRQQYLAEGGTNQLSRQSERDCKALTRPPSGIHARSGGYSGPLPMSLHIELRKIDCRLPMRALTRIRDAPHALSAAMELLQHQSAATTLVVPSSSIVTLPYCERRTKTSP